MESGRSKYVCPWCVGGVAKLWEWAANPWGAVFTMLLRQSSGGGGGDYYGYAMKLTHNPDCDCNKHH